MPSYEAVGQQWRPILVLAIDGADVPTRPETAKGQSPGRKGARAKRARWTGEWREAKGFRSYLIDNERIIQVLSWHQVQTDEEAAEALRQVKAAGLIPEGAGALVCNCRWDALDLEASAGVVSVGGGDFGRLPLR
jgi:hypothetical protein